MEGARLEIHPANSIITHTPSGKTLLRQGGGSRRQARPACRREAEGSEGLEDRRQGRCFGSTPSTRQRRDDLRRRRQGARNAERRDEGFSGFGGKLKSFVEAKSHRHEGHQEVVRSTTSCRRRCRRLVARQTALDALPIVWVKGSNAKVSSVDCEWLAEGLDDARPAFIGNQNGNARAALQGRQESRGGLRLSLPEPRPRWSR